MQSKNLVKLAANVAELLQQLPGPTSKRWPQGEHFVQAFTHGSMSLELYAPIGADSQTPHQQDELYLIYSGQATLALQGKSIPCGPGSGLFVPAGAEHRFESFSSDFSTWVVFWGPAGGEQAAQVYAEHAAGAGRGSA